MITAPPADMTGETEYRALISDLNWLAGWHTYHRNSAQSALARWSAQGRAAEAGAATDQLNAHTRALNAIEAALSRLQAQHDGIFASKQA